MAPTATGRSIPDISWDNDTWAMPAVAFHATGQSGIKNVIIRAFGYAAATVHAPQMLDLDPPDISHSRGEDVTAWCRKHLPSSQGWMIGAIPGEGIYSRFWS